MSGTIELRAFMGLAELFKERCWSIPMLVNIGNGLTGPELITMLNIPEKQVEIIFINGKVFLPFDAVVNHGDRVALVPPGTPGPYRVLLGFKKE
ncbi:MAG: MoaD/ThiS family protein [Sporomusaceae bacterium]|nr:MoaD/ThiS family protein [Sporomusaceae bacterium]